MVGQIALFSLLISRGNPPRARTISPCSGRPRLLPQEDQAAPAAREGSLAPPAPAYSPRASSVPPPSPPDAASLLTAPPAIYTRHSAHVTQLRHRSPDACSSQGRVRVAAPAAGGFGQFVLSCSALGVRTWPCGSPRALGSVERTLVSRRERCLVAREQRGLTDFCICVCQSYVHH